MFFKKVFLIPFLVLLLSFQLKSQGIPGYNVSNYAGISGFFLQPASIADSRYKFDMTLVGADFTFGNNYVKVIRRWDKEARNPSNVDWKDAGYIRVIDNDSKKNLNLGLNVTLPSFMVSLNKGMSVAFTNRIRSLTNFSHISPELAQLAYNGFDVPSLFNLKLNADQFNINTMTWNEYGLGYGQTLLNKGPHFLKAGGQVKILTGILASYIYARDFSYSWKNKDTLNVFSSEFGYAASDNLGLTTDELTDKYLENPKNLMGLNHPNFGFDIGIVYEYRPDKESYLYDLDGKRNLERRDKNKYKYRVGVSLLDLGKIKFKKSSYSADFKANFRDFDISKFDIDGNDPIRSLNESLDSMYIQTPNEFTMSLPTAFSIQFDYQIWKTFYLNFTSFISPRFIKTESKVQALNYYTVAPRWDSKWFGVMLPLNFNSYGQSHAGLALRAGPLVVGTNDIGAFLYSEYIRGYDVHFALKVPIFQRKPKDKDGDGVSNKKDLCPKEKGTWATRGCPDRDGDGVADKDDECPDEPGLKNLKGCPDSDGDGIADKYDACPDVAGLAEFNGCPDRDGDGIPDHEDLCPDEAGPKATQGCPDRDGDGVADKDDKCPDVAGSPEHNGCPDTDGDGVYDDVDECIHTPGPASNNGCPEIPKEEKAVITKVFSTLEFELGSAVIKKSSYPALDELYKLLRDNPDYRLRVDGYTDNVGDEEKNLKLSESRAVAVQEYLYNKNINPDRIDVRGHGSANPVDSNDTEEGRKHNRRVEIEIRFK